MKSMLIAVTVVGAAIAGLMLYNKKNPGNLNARQMKDKAKKIIAGESSQQFEQS